MTRQEVYDDIEATMGLVPKFFQTLSDQALEHEWGLFKAMQLEPSPIPNKYRELIGLGVAAAIKCRYCTFFHTEAAKVYGATDDEIENALYIAKDTSGWSAYMNGLQLDLDDFKREVREALEYAKAHMPAGREEALEVEEEAVY